MREIIRLQKTTTVFENGYVFLKNHRYKRYLNTITTKKATTQQLPCDRHYLLFKY